MKSDKSDEQCQAFFMTAVTLEMCHSFSCMWVLLSLKAFSKVIQIHPDLLLSTCDRSGGVLTLTVFTLTGRVWSLRGTCRY